MFKKNFLPALSILLLVVVAVVASLFPAATQAQQSNGEPNFIFVNYFGQELFLDLDDTTYTIPGTATAPEGGRLALNLTPGEHKYAANVPGLTGSAGEFTITPGEVVAKAARFEKGGVPTENGVVVGDREDLVYVFDFNPFADPAAEMSVTDTWQPAPAPSGQGSIVWINHSGESELTVDLNGQIYKVPPKMNDIPGRLQIDVAPGTYRYTASVPNGSYNGEVTVVAGEVVGLSIIPGIREQPEAEIGEEFDPMPPVELQLVQENLTARAGTSQPEETAPAGSPSTGEQQAAPVDVEPATTAPEGLTVKNYSGDTLTLTINNQVYKIEPTAEATLSLPPGQYSYTASIPSVATTGTVDLAAGQNVALSIAINVAGDVLSVYQN